METVQDEPGLVEHFSLGHFLRRLVSSWMAFKGCSRTIYTKKINTMVAMTRHGVPSVFGCNYLALFSSIRFNFLSVRFK